MKIKDRLKQFGILVLRSMWPSRARKSVQHLGLLMLGLGIMFGASQARAARQAIAGIIRGETTPSQQTVTVKSSVTDVNASKPSLESASDTTTVTGGANIVDLIGESELILRGAVKEVTDGFENGLPYTEVTVQVSEALRGEVGDEYTFRQFGLTKPRRMENGKIYLGVTPDGWSRYSVGEDAMFFLYKQASMTGLRTTVGLGQGKVVFQGGNAVSQFDNQGLFENVTVDQKLLNDKDKRLLATRKGIVNAEGFKSFVRRAVNGKWIEGGKLRRANK